MKITEEFLRSKKACPNSLDWFLEQGTQDPFELIDFAVADGRHADVFWVFKFFLNKTEAVKFSVFCAELVLHVFEEERPQDDRPRKAINAAKKWLETGADNNCAAFAALAAEDIPYCAALAALAALDAVARVSHVAACDAAACADITVLPQIIDYIKQYIGEKGLHEDN